MILVFKVEVEISRIQGKFVSKNSLAEEIIDALESANPEMVGDDSEYEIQEWTITQEDT